VSEPIENLDQSNQAEASPPDQVPVVKPDLLIDPLDAAPVADLDLVNAVADAKTATEPASSAPFANPPLPPASGKRGHPLILLLLALGGTLVVIVMACNIFDVPLPYFLVNLDPILEQNLRYKAADSAESKDWRNELLIEQTIWTNEVNKIKLGQNGAKPEMFKRDYLFYLADSYFRNDPHFSEAKAAYVTGSAEPRVAHKDGYDLSDAELSRKIGYCCMRLGQYEEAEKYLRQALKLFDQNTDPNLKIMSMGNGQFCLDVLTECAIRQNHIPEAESLIKQRLERIHLQKIEGCVEHYLLFDYALLQEKKGDAVKAEEFYKKAIAQEEADDKTRGVLIGSPNDNNRMLAYILREYSRFLRTQKRGAESFALMDRACGILNNGP